VKRRVGVPTRAALSPTVVAAGRGRALALLRQHRSVGSRPLYVISGSLMVGLVACTDAASREPSASGLGAVDASSAGSAGLPGPPPPEPAGPGSGVSDGPTPASPVDAGTASVVSSCSQLSRRACMASTSCTLLLAASSSRAGTYVCRPAEPPCEVGLAQSELSGSEGARAECESRSGCGVDPGSCYCACRGSGQTAVPDDAETPQCSCACGGGAPPRCALVTE
jgi:hypothetical protein